MQSIQKCGLEDCKVAKDIDIALLRSCRKDWSIEMKNVQISQELFFLLVRYFLIGQEETEPEIVKALEKKMDALVMRELYTPVSYTHLDVYKRQTQGRGNYSMFFEKYEPVPKNVQEKVLAAKAK